MLNSAVFVLELCCIMDEFSIPGIIMLWIRSGVLPPIGEREGEAALC